MDAPDNDVALNNPSSSSSLELDSYLNTLIKDISDDECDSIICSHKITRKEDKQPTVICTASSGKQNGLLQFDDLAEHKSTHLLYRISGKSEDNLQIDDTTVVDELNRRRINLCSQNAVMKYATVTDSSSHVQAVLQPADKTKILDVREVRNTRKHSYPFIALTLDKDCYPSNSWPSDASKLRKEKHASDSKQNNINRTCDFKSKLWNNKDNRSASPEISIEGRQSVPEVSCYNRQQQNVDVISEALDSKITLNTVTKAAASVYEASLSQESLFSQSQESLFDDHEAVTCVTDELVSVKKCTQHVTLSTAVATSLDFTHATQSHARVLALCSKEKTSPRENTSDPLTLSTPLETEQAISLVAALLPSTLVGQSGAACLSSVSSSQPHEFVDISAHASHVLNESCFHTAEGRHDDLPLTARSRHADLPLIKGARHDDLSLIEGARHADLSLMEGARYADLSLMEGAKQADLSMMEGARHADLPLMEGARHADIPLMEGARHADIPLMEGARHADLPLMEGARHADLPLMEGARHADIPLMEGARQADLSLMEGARHADLSLIEGARHADLSLIEGTRHADLSLIEGARHADLSLIEGTRHADLSLIEGTRHADLSLIEGTRHADLSLIEGARHADLSLIEGARHADLSLIEGARHADLSLIEGTRHADLSLIEGTRHADLSPMEGVRHADVPLTKGIIHTDLPLTEVARHDNLPLIEEAKHDNLPLIEEIRHDNLPLIEEAKHDKQPLIEGARHDNLPLMEEARNAELYVIEAERLADLPLLEETGHAELPLHEEVRQTEQPLIKETRRGLPLIGKGQFGQPRTDKTRQSKPSLIEEDTKTERLLIKGTRHTELMQTEKTKHAKLLPTRERLNSECNAQCKIQDLVLSTSENELFLPFELQNERHHTIIVTQTQEKSVKSQYTETSDRGIQLKQKKNVPGSPHALDSLHSVNTVPHSSNTSGCPVCLRQDETFFDATQMIKRQKRSSNENVWEGRSALKKISVADASPEYEISTCIRGSTKSQQYHSKSLVSDNIRTFDCRHQEMPRSPPVLISMEGIPYMIPSSDHIVPQCEVTLAEARTHVTAGEGGITQVTDDDEDINTGVTGGDYVDSKTGVTGGDDVDINTGVTGGDDVDINTGVTGGDDVDSKTGVTDTDVDSITGVTVCGVGGNTRVTGDDDADSKTGVNNGGMDGRTRGHDGMVDINTGVTNGDIDIKTGVNNGGMDGRTVSNDGIVDINTGVTSGRLCNNTGVTDGDVDSETATNDSAEGNCTCVTEGHGTFKDSSQTVLSYVRELQSTVSITKSAHNSEDLSNHKTTSSCNICHQGSSIRISLEILPDPHQREETTTGTSDNNDALLPYSSEHQAHSHHSEQISLIPSLEHSAACEEQKVPEVEPCEDLSLSEASMYSNPATDEPGDLKCKNQMKQAFQWNSVYGTAINKSLTDKSSDSTLDSLSDIVPIAHSHRPLRIGLSRKQKVKRLHNKQ